MYNRNIFSDALCRKKEVKQMNKDDLKVEIIARAREIQIVRR